MLAEYDTEGIVTGCWGMAEHQKIISELGYGNYYTEAAQAAYDADDIYGKKKILHGKHNYVRNLQFMYKVAKKMSTSCFMVNYALDGSIFSGDDDCIDYVSFFC